MGGGGVLRLVSLHFRLLISLFLFSGCTVSAGYINFRNLVDMINVKINFFNVELGSPFVPR